MSSFLFLIFSEGLSILMEEVLKQREIKGIQVSREGPKITHLLFIDHCLLFGEANDKGVIVLKWVLKEYKECSGQCINFDKFIILFRANVVERERLEISSTLGVRYSNDPVLNFGLPNIVGHNKKMAFQSLNDKIKHKIDSWSTCFLLQARREVFVMSVLQATPMYTIMCFLLPKSFCSELENIISTFWWQ